VGSIRRAPRTNRRPQHSRHVGDSAHREALDASQGSFPTSTATLSKSDYADIWFRTRNNWLETALVQIRVCTRVLLVS